MIRVLSESIDLQGTFPDINNAMRFTKATLFEYFMKDLQGSLLIEYDFQNGEAEKQLEINEKGEKLT